MRIRGLEILVFSENFADALNRKFMKTNLFHSFYYFFFTRAIFEKVYVLRRLIFSSFMTEVPIYRNQSIDWQSKSMDWVLYDINWFLYDIDLRHEKIKFEAL